MPCNMPFACTLSLIIPDLVLWQHVRDRDERHRLGDSRRMHQWRLPHQVLRAQRVHNLSRGVQDEGMPSVDLKATHAQAVNRQHEGTH